MIKPVQAKPTTHGTSSTAKTIEAAKKAVGKLDWSADPLPRLDNADTNPERMKLVAKMPKGVQEAFNYYFKNVEQEDWGSVGVYKLQVGGERFYVVHTSTDGDDGYTELFNYAGKRVATGLSGFKDDGKGGFEPTTTWDKKLGAVRVNTQN